MNLFTSLFRILRILCIAYCLLLPNPLLAMTDTTTRIEIGVLDHSGIVANLVEAMGRQSIQLSDLNGFEGRLLIIGPNSLDTSLLPLLKSMVRQGTNVLCLKQRVLPVEALSGLRPVYGTFSLSGTMSCKNHPVLSGVDGWDRSGTTTNIILAMPDRGNFRPIITSEATQAVANGSLSQTSQILLLEIPYGHGEFMFCQLDVFEQGTDTLFQNMLDYCLNYKGKSVTPAVYVYPNTKTMEILNNIGVPGTRNPLKFDGFSLALVCVDEKLIKLMSIMNKEFSSQLREFVSNGGRALIPNLTPQTFPLLKKIFLEAEESDSSIIDSPESGIMGRLIIGKGDATICQLNLETEAGVRMLLQILTDMDVMLP